MIFLEDVKDMSMEELIALRKAIDDEMQRGRNIERDKHIQAICDHMNALRQGKYNVQLPIEYECPDCASGDSVDILYYFCDGRKMSPQDFEVW